MAVPSILQDLVRAGVEFETDGERIRWRNSGGRMTPDVVEVLRAHKAEVIRFLAVPAEVLPLAPPPTTSEPSRDTDDPFRHGRAFNGTPMTWTGRIVSLDEWRRLTIWDRHGPDGRVFCGICREWVEREGDCASPGCWKGKRP